MLVLHCRTSSPTWGEELLFAVHACLAAVSLCKCQASFVTVCSENVLQKDKQQEASLLET